MEEIFREAGLTVKVKIHNTIYTSKFLQCLPVPSTKGHIMVRNPGRALL